MSLKSKAKKVVSKAKNAVTSYAKNVAGGAKIVASAVKNEAKSVASNPKKAITTVAKAVNKASNPVASLATKAAEITAKKTVSNLPAQVKTKVNQAVMKAQVNGGIVQKAIDNIRLAAGKGSVSLLASPTPFPDQLAADTAAKNQSTNGTISAPNDFISKVNDSVRTTTQEGTAVDANTPQAKNMSLATGGYVDQNGLYVAPDPNSGSFTSATMSQDTFPTDTQTTNFGDVATPTADSTQTDATPSTTTSSAQNGNSAPTSYTFNTNALANTQATANRFKMSLDSITQDPWKYNSNPQEGKMTLVDSYATQFAKNWPSAQDFYNNLSSNPELQKSLTNYFNAGGTPAQIANKIVPVTNDIVPAQDTATYLDKINAPKTKEGLQAETALFQEKQLAQEEIMRQNGIPKELENIYFGTEDQVGLLQQQKELANEKKRLIERKELAEEASLREQAQYQIDKNNADAEIARADIEENRLNMKTYLTGTLAKLGALMTTGAAPIALANLEQKYQRQKSELDTKLSFANREITVKLNKEISDLENERDADIQDINEDLSKSESDARKEIFKAQREAASKIYDITSHYAGQLRSEVDKYKAEAKANADKYIASFSTLAGKGLSVSKIASLIDSNGRLIPGAALASALKPKGESNYGFTKDQINRLEYAGIDPRNTKAARDFLYGRKETVDDAVYNAVSNFKDIKEANGWRGINPNQYKDVQNIIKSEFGAAALKKLDDAISEAGLKVDYKK